MYNSLAKTMETALIWDLDVTESTTVRIEVMSLIVVSNHVTLYSASKCTNVHTFQVNYRIS